jgi:hypothetical protein
MDMVPRKQRLRTHVITLPLLLLHLLALPTTTSLTPVEILRRDWVALNMRSTCRHLLRPSTPVGASECLKLKVEIQQAVQDGEFVVDAFSTRAAEHSIDADTRDAGGLLGTRLQQGEIRSRRSSACPAPELDRAAFEVPIGKVYGPFQSDYGYHLFLVEERIGYRRQDGELTRVVAEPFAPGDARVRSVLAKPDTSEEGLLVLPYGVVRRPADAGHDWLLVSALPELPPVRCRVSQLITDGKQKASSFALSLLAAVLAGQLIAQLAGQLSPDVAPGSFLGIEFRPAPPLY